MTPAPLGNRLRVFVFLSLWFVLLFPVLHGLIARGFDQATRTIMVGSEGLLLSLGYGAIAGVFGWFAWRREDAYVARRARWLVSFHFVMACLWCIVLVGGLLLRAA